MTIESGSIGETIFLTAINIAFWWLVLVLLGKSLAKRDDIGVIGRTIVTCAAYTTGALAAVGSLLGLVTLWILGAAAVIAGGAVFLFVLRELVRFLSS